jgi:GTP-binding protein EngB required for normal cell division
MLHDTMSQVFSVFDGVADVCQKYNPDGLVSARKTVEAKRKSPSATIMVYGVYNAGKSTLINALLGKEEARVSDKPETDSIARYRWGGFEILDTPGIDAPIHHEQVTQEQLRAADVVIFVVNPLGTVEEAKTLKILLQLIERGKQVFIILNSKNQLEPEDAERLKDELRKRIQDKAEEMGLKGVLKDIPTLEINAKTALKARMEGKQNLLEHSGFPRLEDELAKFLSSIDAGDVLASFVTELIKFIEQTRDLLDARKGNDASINRIDSFSEEIDRREINIRSNLKSSIEASAASIERRAFSIISSNPDTAQSGIETLIQAANTEVINTLEEEFNRLKHDASRIQENIVDDIKPSGASGGAPSIDLASVKEESSFPAMEKNSGENIGKLLTGLGTLVKPDHIVSALELGKAWLPAVFKGIGPATMAKIGGTIVSKAIPIVSVVITALQTLFGSDPEEERIREQIRAEERREQAIRDVCKDIAWQFTTELTKDVNKNIQSIFSQVNDRLAEIREGLSASQHELSTDRAEIVRALETLKVYV